ncbi:MAG: 2-oxo acid dehydrogenase subunit E2, partial [Anaerolineae bacterium]|nr:2-oxo acid dehydrogenase subunit E2 [Anaerolineae bacterium]
MAELINMPKLGFDMREGKLGEWVVKEGDAVGQGETIAIIETDKASVEVPAFRAGVLHKILVPAGESVPIGVPIAVIGEAGEQIDLAALGVTKAEAKAEVKVEARGEVGAEPVTQADKAAAPLEGGRLAASPVALRMAAELGIDINKVPGSGPAGRIIKRDIEAYLAAQDQAAKAAKAAPALSVTPPMAIPSYEPTMEGYRAVPLTGMRQTIARRMVESKTTAPHFYITMDVDMAAAMALRSQLNALLPESDKISVNDFIIKASALALRQFPNINASFAGSEIHVHDQVNVGIAVARETGLVVTVVRDCDKKPLAEIAKDAR